MTTIDTTVPMAPHATMHRAHLTAPRPSVTATHGIPGRAGRLVAQLGDRARVHGACDETGAAVLADIADSDVNEVRAVLRLVFGLDGPVLDLAAGLGRMTVPLLALRREVTALELSGDVLDRLVRRLQQAPAPLRQRCTTVQADMADFAIDRSYAAVVLGGASVSLLDGVGRMGLYRSVRRHLAPGGRFLLSTVDHGASTALPPELGTEVVTPSGHAYRVYEYWQADAPTWTFTALRKDYGHGPVTVCTTTQRVLGAAQLQVELERAGMVVVSRTQITEPGRRHPVVLIEAALPDAVTGPARL
ncbi:daptide-type RiPP biosynthesis methyltransferase [Georgenia yuyongxinii]|nr:daptide-type RiPP biosynthesis methyltransferase [Georgenia yuyongxinii]